MLDAWHPPSKLVAQEHLLYSSTAKPKAGASCAAPTSNMLGAGAGVAIAAAVLFNVYTVWIIRAMWVRRNEMLIRARSPALAAIECLTCECSTTMP